MKNLMLFAAILCLALGVLWMGQGTGYIHWPAGSFMISDVRWTYTGAFMVILSIGLIAYALRRRD